VPKKNIYIKDADLALFDRAEQLGGDSLSQVIAETLRRFVAAKEAEAAGMKEVTLEVGVWCSQGTDDVRKVRFLGRLLAEGRKYRGSMSDRKDRFTDYKIYSTRTGKIVVHMHYVSLWEREDTQAGHVILDRLPAHGEDVDGSMPLPGSLLEEAAAALGQELVEWVD